MKAGFVHRSRLSLAVREGANAVHTYKEMDKAYVNMLRDWTIVQIVCARRIDLREDV